MSLEFRYSHSFGKTAQTCKLDESARPSGCGQTDSGSSAYNAIVGTSVTGQVNPGSSLKRILLRHHPRGTQATEESQLDESRVSFTGDTETGIASLCGLTLDMIDGEGKKCIFHGRVRHINHRTGGTVVGCIGNPFINQELLADNSPQAAPFGQLFFKTAGHLARAEVGITGIRIIETYVNSHGYDLMKP